MFFLCFLLILRKFLLKQGTLPYVFPCMSIGNVEGFREFGKVVIDMNLDRTHKTTARRKKDDKNLRPATLDHRLPDACPKES